MPRPFAAPALAAAFALTALAPAAHAQTALRFGQSVSGTLSASDPVLDGGGARYDAYTIRATSNGPVTVSMRSDVFDAYLVVSGSGVSEETLCADDDSYPGEGLDARCVVEMEDGQTVTVRASSLTASEGAYTILAETGAGEVDPPYDGGDYVEEPAAPILLPSTTASALGAGGAVRATADADGPVFTAGETTYPYRLYRVAARAGQTMTFDVRAEFDATLRLGTLDGSTFTEVTADDDTQGTNPQIVYTFDADGDVVLLVTGYDGASGPFEIEARVGDFAYTPPDPDGPLLVDLARVRGVALGSETAGEIDLADEQGGLLVDVYRYRATRSGPVTIAVTTSGGPAFDAYLATGALDGATFTPDQTDDDSGAGSNPVLVATLSAGQEIGIAVRAFAPQAIGAQSAMGAYTLFVREGDVSAEYADAVESPFTQILDFATARPLTVGAAVRGTLGASSPAARVSGEDDDARYELYSLPAGASGIHTFSVEADFDASLELGTRDGNGIVTVGYDDDSGAGLNPAFVATLNANEAFFLVVRGFGSDAAGTFSVLVQEGDQSESVIEERMPDRVDIGLAVPVRVGGEVTGELSDSDPSTKPWGSATDLYTLTAEAGETLVITLAMAGREGVDGIDPYVEIGTVDNGVFTPLGSNDDGGESLNSRLEYNVMTTGRHIVRVSSVNRNTGGYRLTVGRL